MPDKPIPDEVITVVVVEDEPLIRALLVRVLSLADDITVVASAGDAASASRVIEEHRPHVVLLDLDLGPGDNGFAIGRAAKSRDPGVGIVVLTGHPDFNQMRSIILEEGRGWSFLLKRSIDDSATLARAIRGSATGMTVIDPQVVANLRPRSDSPLATLSPRQLEVLRLVAQGFTTEAIADRLSVRPRTVVHHVDEVYERLGIRGTPDMNPRLHAALVYLRDSQGFIP